MSEAPPRPGIRRGKCRYCGKRLALTKDGRVKKHMITAGPTTLVPGQRVPCGGGGQIPS